MLELLKDFFTLKSAGVRGLRFIVTALGAIGLAADIPWPEEWVQIIKTISGVAVVVGPLITGYSKNVAEEAAKNTG